MSQLRAALIGAGPRGLNHLDAIAAFDDVYLAAVCDPSDEARNAAAAKYEPGAAYASVDEMLDAEELDIVVIATAAGFRPPIVRDVAASGVRGIYMEKPIANSLALADAMIEQCRAGDTKLAIGHQRRWTPRFIAIKDAIADGAIGRPTHGLSYWTAGRIGSNGTHFLDMINFVIDGSPVEVTGTVHYGADRENTSFNESLELWMSRDPGVVGHVKYADGYRHMVYCMPDVLLAHTHMFCGSRGRIDLFEVDEEPVLYRARDADSRDMRSSDTVRPRTLDTPELVIGESEMIGYRELMECIESGGTPTSSGEDGMKALEMVVGFHLSSQAGGSPVALPIPEADRGFELNLH